MKTAIAIIVGVVFLSVGFAAMCAPYVFSEWARWFDHHSIVDPAPVKIAKGEMVDDYFAVQDLGEGTYAIGEPRYYQ
jgi:hydroxyacylglutathione hydrolase